MHPVNSLKPIMAAALVMTALPIQAQQPSADASLDTRRSYDIPVSYTHLTLPTTPYV